MRNEMKSRPKADGPLAYAPGGKKAIVWFCALILGLSTITFFPIKTHAATLDVCPVGCTYATIAAALAAANDGDTITVGAGVYNESLTIPNKNNLSLIGAGASVTTISNNNIAISNVNANTNLRLEGFTITSAMSNGFGCTNFAGTPSGTITNNIFANSSAGGAGGISFWGDCSFNIYNNTFSGNANGIFMLLDTAASNIYNNTFTTNSYAGIFATQITSTSNLIHNNTFTSNAFGIHIDSSIASIYNNDIHNNGTQATNEPGAGISSGGSTLQIYANKIYQNTNPNEGGGIAVGGSGVGSNIFNNYIAQNAAGGIGGGIYSSTDSTPIYNNTIVNNTATGGRPNGMGEQKTEGQTAISSDPALQEKIDSILAQVENDWNDAQINYGPGNYGGNVAIYHAQAPVPSFYNNIVWGSDDILDGIGDLVINYSDVQEPWTGSGINNKSSNPELTGYVLGSGSPCIDAGTSAGAPSHDIDGTSRPQRTGYDIGAYELPGAATLPESGGAGHNQNLILVLITALSAALIFIATRKIIEVKN